MPKKDFGNIVGSCPVCDIACWDSAGGKPVVWPCNVEKCPYENPLTQNRDFDTTIFSGVGSGLGQIDF